MKRDRRGGRRQSCSLSKDAVVGDETTDCQGRPTIDVVEWTALSLKIGVRGWHLLKLLAVAVSCVDICLPWSDWDRT